MAGLVAYGSSDEEDEPQESQNVSPPSRRDTEKASQLQKENGTEPVSKPNGHRETSTTQKTEDSSPIQTAPLVGPAIGPALPTTTSIESPLRDQDGQSSAPQSPYTANRALLRELTLPTIPSLDIPPSPPHSPPHNTNAKFSNFLKLKKQGVHFNERIAQSSAIRNPRLMQKLSDFAGLDADDEYATTLPKELWDPKCFPAYAFKEELAKSQKDVANRKEVEKQGRTTLDFVPATASGESTRSNTPGTGVPSRAAPKSTAERVMEGLGGGRSNSPQKQNGAKRKTRFES